jgi:CBS domain-containing protein
MSTLARDIMNREVISVSMTMDLRDLAKLFLERGITGAPVVDEHGDLAGVVSQTDLIYYGLTRDDELASDSMFYHTARMEGRHVPAGFQIEDTNTGVVADVMTPLVHSVGERASVDAVARMMTGKHIHRVVVRRGRKVTGIISALDVLRAQLGDETKSGVPGSARGKRTNGKRANGRPSSRKRRNTR